MKYLKVLILVLMLASCDMTSEQEIMLKEVKRSDNSTVRISWFGTGPVGSTYTKITTPEMGDSIFGKYDSYDSVAYVDLKSDTILVLGLTKKYPEKWSVDTYAVKLPNRPVSPIK